MSTTRSPLSSMMSDSTSEFNDHSSMAKPISSASMQYNCEMEDPPMNTIEINSNSAQSKNTSSVIVATEAEEDHELSDLLSVVSITSENSDAYPKQNHEHPHPHPHNVTQRTNPDDSTSALSLSSSGSRPSKRRQRNSLVAHQKSILKRMSSMSLGDSIRSTSSAQKHNDPLGESTVSGGSIEAPSSPALKRVESNVSFQSVNVREYDRTIGDNPSCSSGIPISLDWSHSSEVIHNVNDYEKIKHMKNKRNVTRITARKRESLVKMNLGYSDEEIAMYMKETRKVQRSRSLTDLISPYWRIQHACQSASRKVNRKLQSKKKTAPQTPHEASVEEAITISSSYHSYDIDYSQEYTLPIADSDSEPKQKKHLKPKKKIRNIFSKREKSNSQSPLDLSIGLSSNRSIDETLQF